LPLNLLLQVFLLPVYLLIFGGTTGFIELSFLVESILIVLFIPLALSVLTKALLKSKQQFAKNLLSKLSALPIISLSLAIVAMFASQGQLLLDNLNLLWKLTIPILLYFVINFIVGRKIGQLLKFSQSDKVSLNMTTLARNSPIALAIAMTAFPDQPLIALTLVIGPLLELPILAIITQILLFISKGKTT
jgi:arsenite transporter